MGISLEMSAHLEGTTNLAVFMKLTAKDGAVMRVCTCTRNKIVNGELYYAYPVEPTTLQATNGLKPDNLEITAVYSGLFTRATLRAKKWLGARVEYQVLNYRDFSMGYAVRRVGFIGETAIGKFAARPELKSLSQKLSEPIGATYNADCDVVELGDTRCKVDLNGNTATGYRIRILAHVTAAANAQQFTVAFDQTIKPADAAVLIAPDNFYRFGKFKFTSGLNNGLGGQIIASEGNNLTLLLPLFYPLAVGGTIELTSGCNRGIAHCRDLYANAINNRSFYCLPGRERLLNKNV